MKKTNSVLRSATGVSAKTSKEFSKKEANDLLKELTIASINYYKSTEDVMSQLESEIIQCNKVITERNNRIKDLEAKMEGFFISQKYWKSEYYIIEKEFTLEENKSLWQHFKDAIKKAWRPV